MMASGRGAVAPCRGAVAPSVAVGKGTGMPSWTDVLARANGQTRVQAHPWPDGVRGRVHTS